MTHSPSPELIDLVRRLSGKWYGSTAMCHCPLHNDRTPSLSLRQGERAILVTCHAGCDRHALVRQLGLGGRTSSSIPALPAHPPERSMRAAAIALWNKAGPVQGSLGEHYLRKIRRIACALADVRFAPACPIGAGSSARFEPALLVALRQRGAIVAIQRIFLDPVSGHCTSKRLLGPARGAAWTNGEPATTLGLCEGFETAAAYTSLTGIKAWSSMGATRFHQVEIPASVKRLILLADNDPAGRGAEARARQALACPGLVIDTQWPSGALNDWAQLLMLEKR